MKLTPEQEAIVDDVCEIIRDFYNLAGTAFMRPKISDAIARALQSEDAARLQSLVRELATWLQGSLNCPSHVWEPDQHDAAQSLIDAARKMTRTP